MITFMGDIYTLQGFCVVYGILISLLIFAWWYLDWCNCECVILARSNCEAVILWYRSFNKAVIMLGWLLSGSGVFIKIIKLFILIIGSYMLIAGAIFTMAVSMTCCPYITKSIRKFIGKIKRKQLDWYYSTGSPKSQIRWMDC